MTNIGAYAFVRCGSLTSVEIADSVISIGICAFLSCNLTSVDIPDSVVSIDDNAFSCRLTSIFIPAGVAHIGKGAFGGGLEKIEVSRNNAVYYSVNNCIIRKGTGMLVMGCKNSIIPSDRGISVIGEEAFCGSGLTSITIPHNITLIEEDAFRDSGLISITILNSRISIDERAFRVCPELKSVTFEGMKEQWKTVYKDGIFAETQVSAVKCSDGEFEI